MSKTIPELAGSPDSTELFELATLLFAVTRRCRNDLVNLLLDLTGKPYVPPDDFETDRGQVTATDLFDAVSMTFSIFEQILDELQFIGGQLQHKGTEK